MRALSSTAGQPVCAIVHKGKIWPRAKAARFTSRSALAKLVVGEDDLRRCADQRRETAPIL